MTELELIIDLHKNSERQGPGSERDTLKALEMIHLPEGGSSKIMDIGCGTGGQTITLASHLNGHITAIDLFPEFLEELNLKSKHLGLSHRIKTVSCSMDKLSFDHGYFDLIWSEGAIYNIGFEHGIKLWKDYLKVGGYLAVSEITWITNTRPKAINDFWTSEYPEIDIASNKIKILENNGYILVGYFFLPQESWINTYYDPMKNRFLDFLDRNDHASMAKKLVEVHESEIELYMKYKDYFSYGFYIARKDE